MLLSGEQGVAATDLADAKRLKTLRDPATGHSLALVTQGQLEVLGARPGVTSAHLALPWLNALRWQPENFDLATTGRWLLGNNEARTINIE